jgi:hypothetical protein
MSLFSDPFFRRGTTLLSGETIENNDAGNPAAGGEIVGQVKVFQDVNPTTGVRNSSRLVWCVAARYKGATVEDGSTVAGEAYVFEDGAPLTQFADKASSTNATVGKAVGVLDEYFTGRLRQNDVVWVVMKGPTSIKRTGAAIASGAAVELSSTAGQAKVYASGIVIAQQIGDGGNAAASVGLTRVNLHSDEV